jgi:hypothetical protein
MGEIPQRRLHQRLLLMAALAAAALGAQGWAPLLQLLLFLPLSPPPAATATAGQHAHTTLFSWTNIA